MYHCDSSACNQCKQDERALSKETNTDMSSVGTKNGEGLFLATVHTFVCPLAGVYIVCVCSYIGLHS